MPYEVLLNHFLEGFIDLPCFIDRVLLEIVSLPPPLPEHLKRTEEVTIYLESFLKKRQGRSVDRQTILDLDFYIKDYLVYRGFVFT